MEFGHMYAQKRRLKRSDDDLLTPKQLQKGDLILVYTLNQHIGKIKKQGFKPCVVEEISSNVVVKSYPHLIEKIHPIGLVDADSRNIKYH